MLLVYYATFVLLNSVQGVFFLCFSLLSKSVFAPKMEIRYTIYAVSRHFLFNSILWKKIFVPSKSIKRKLNMVSVDIFRQIIVNVKYDS